MHCFKTQLKNSEINPNRNPLPLAGIEQGPYAPFVTIAKLQGLSTGPLSLLKILLRHIQGLLSPPSHKCGKTINLTYKNKKKQDKFALAGQICSLKDQILAYEANFKIVKKARTINPINGKCMICPSEKIPYSLQHRRSYLNTRYERVTS